MSKQKNQYVCSDCGGIAKKWLGQCPHCQQWNSLSEVKEVLPNRPGRSQRFAGFAGIDAPKVKRLSEITPEQISRQPVGICEFDRVLGGGLVHGAVILLGGDPGIGKSTLLLQTSVNCTQFGKVLYVTGEESLEQVTLRSKRLGLSQDVDLRLLAETQVERILKAAEIEQPKVLIVDSIQTIFTESLQSAPGGVAQVRESAAILTQFAKRTGTCLFLVGHVTKEGALAGPRVLEHMVDTVLYFEGEQDSRFRLLRAVKNRFGAANELGIFAMTETGLKTVSNPSAIFLSRYEDLQPGSVVMVAWEGTRPLLVEVQALVDESHSSNPRRIAVGLDQQRLAMLLAVLNRHGGIASYDQDVFINVVGGMKITETAADLALLLACVSSLRGKALSQELIVFGEIGLSGEIRPVQRGLERIKEAAKHGFTQAIVPFANCPKQKIDGIEIVGVKHLEDALATL
ncbi:Lon protease 2 [Piscirickettsia salmonis]|uniref:DNA repair protein RadA n=1 Tax=Piscirickettsia salmonis TaxID=1238 RepID=UPI0012B6E0B5|nr:DNA repair protein RadA [Piscirickettsia salmonis]QGP49864.1 Lon protease 2 [Piscirickettsia salmonis]